MNGNSKNAKCRAKGCSISVPSRGYYVGLPQSRCTRCGLKIKGQHAFYDTVDLYDTPDYPESDYFWRIIEYIKKNIFNKTLIDYSG